MLVVVLDPAGAIPGIEVNPKIRLDTVFAQKIVGCFDSDNRATLALMRFDFVDKTWHRPPARYAHECSIVRAGSEGEFWKPTGKRGTYVGAKLLWRSCRLYRELQGLHYGVAFDGTGMTIVNAATAVIAETAEAVSSVTTPATSAPETVASSKRPSVEVV